MYRLLLISFVLICVNAGCIGFNSQISGKWDAVDFRTAADSAATLPADDIQLELFENGTYQYSGASHYMEKGYYRKSWKYLFLTDTLHNPRKSYTLKVTSLSKDTMVLEMARDSLKEWLIFRRME